MRTLTLVLVALAVAGHGAAPNAARASVHSFRRSPSKTAPGESFVHSFGGSFAFLSGDDGEIGVAVSGTAICRTTTAVPH